MKHTPGPWRPKISDETGLGVFAAGKSKHGICTVLHWADPETGPANCRVIAQSPAMLDVIMKMNAAWAEGRFEPSSEFRAMVARTLEKAA